MAVAISPTVRAILETNLDMPADEIIVRAKARGVKAPDKSIRDVIYNMKSQLRKKAAKPVMATAARTTAPAKPMTAPVKSAVAPAKVAAAPVKTATAPAKTSAPTKAPSSSTVESLPLSTVFSNVTLVNKVVGIAGGVDQARQVAEAVKACGGVEAFLKHLDLVAGIKSA